MRHTAATSPASGSLVSSFRDPSGIVFRDHGRIYRQIRPCYADQYDHLIGSGLCDVLTAENLLLDHIEVDANQFALQGDTHKVIAPRLVPFISYSYEWCFRQLQSAALTTLQIEKIALEHGMTLKDASSFNIQFLGCNPTLIDTISFDFYREGAPWIAYRQFCQHFLAPLALMSYQHSGTSKLLQVYIDGIPLELAARLLPLRAWTNMSLLVHVFIHAEAQKKYEGAALANPNKSGSGMSLTALKAMVDNLIDAVSSLKSPCERSHWSKYYCESNYSCHARGEKEKIVSEFLHQASAATVWDIGANVGVYSLLAASNGSHTVSIDSDPACVEANYAHCRYYHHERILPLVMDLNNPSPSIGWANEERMSLIQRGPADAVLALALIHHLAIGNNVPFEMIASFMATICHNLIIEFVPKNDSQVQRLLASRQDIFADYRESSFERCFERFFKIEKKAKLNDSDRIIYLMRSR